MDAPMRKSYPYASLIVPLIAAVKRASRSVVQHVLRHGEVASIPPSLINREFIWLVLVTPDGKNRHLVEAPEGLASLRNSELRAKSGWPPAVRKALTQMAHGSTDEVIDFETAWKTLSPYTQEDPTRISSLIIESFGGLTISRSRSRTAPTPHEEPNSVVDSPENSATNKFAEYVISGLPSPMSIVYDFLTVPDMPGTRAFALLACRNHLFAEFELVPRVGASDLNGGTFAVSEVEDAMSILWTSMRTRNNSRGQDKLPPGSPGDVNGLVRHYLAMRGMLHLHFPTIDECLSYFSNEPLLPRRLRRGRDSKSAHYEFEFGKSDHLEKLPDAGEIVNELWGLPIPIRGADTIFRGGIKFSTRQGLVVAIHGGPGSGKTSLALALSAYVAPLGIQTLYITAEEVGPDLVQRVTGLVPDGIKRLDFFPEDIESCIRFEHLPLPANSEFDRLRVVETALTELATSLRARQHEDRSAEFRIPKACNSVIVLDGVHDLFASVGTSASGAGARPDQIGRLYRLIETLRELRALVIMTTGVNWAGDSTLDYLVDMAIRLNFESVEEYGSKPDRRLTLSKARHQLCAAGTHGFQIAGKQGVRFSPQINYQLDRRSYWKARLPDKTTSRTALRRARLSSNESVPRTPPINSVHSVDVFDGSHVFINGQGSGGKAALALRLAMSPVSTRGSAADGYTFRREKILIISFLYPLEYYDVLYKRIQSTLYKEYSDATVYKKGVSRLAVIHLYPGHLRPHNLYNRIEWELEGAELKGDPYTAVIIDGIHNVFLQFPEIEKYSLFWPQIYNSLRSRSLTTISTHTTLALPYSTATGGQASVIDDRRSEPLRHALIQKSDFQFEVDPWMSSPFRSNWNLSPEESLKYSNLFLFKVVSSLDQRVPPGFLLWNREDHNLIEFPYLPATQARLF